MYSASRALALPCYIQVISMYIINFEKVAIINNTFQNLKFNVMSKGGVQGHPFLPPPFLPSPSILFSFLPPSFLPSPSPLSSFSLPLSPLSDPPYTPPYQNYQLQFYQVSDGNWVPPWIIFLWKSIQIWQFQYQFYVTKTHWFKCH